MALYALKRWRDARGRAVRARRYVETLMREPDPDIVATLAGVSDHDSDHARWELRYLQRAAGLLLAERDALDDQTASDVAAALDEAHAADPNIASDRRAVATEQFNARLRDYRAALADRTSAHASFARLGAVLLRYAGARAPSAETERFAESSIATMFQQCNAALRAAFGEVNLPPDVAPSRMG